MSKKTDAIQKLKQARFCTNRVNTWEPKTPQDNLMDMAFQYINEALVLLGHKEEPSA